MQNCNRRDVLRMGASLAAGMGLSAWHGDIFAKGLDEIAAGRAKVLWLEGMSCSGCSVSLLNAEDPGPVEVLTELISLVYHPVLSAIQGADAVEVIHKQVEGGDYLLAFEGAIPTTMPGACLMEGKPLAEILPAALRGAKAVVAVGTCASFGGIPAAEGNLTGAVSVRQFMEQQGLPVEGRLVNCPGCPTHPQSLLGTVAYVAAKGYPPVDPTLLTPNMFYAHSVHDECPRFHYWEKRVFAEKFGDEGCLFKLGCLGPLSHTNCPRSQWNSGANWCIRAGAPCTACTSENFARKRDFPFYRKCETYYTASYTEADRQGVS
ncbi:MAG: hydrogenase small subunit [Pirellulales bacterium]|nr:hydrogenase small subunit [Pirellulales bacterium]